MRWENAPCYSSDVSPFQANSDNARSVRSSWPHEWLSKHLALVDPSLPRPVPITSTPRQTRQHHAHLPKIRTVKPVTRPGRSSVRDLTQLPDLPVPMCIFYTRVTVVSRLRRVLAGYMRTNFNECINTTQRTASKLGKDGRMSSSRRTAAMPPGRSLYQRTLQSMTIHRVRIVH